ncbi:hypothetical protein SK128_006743 [Halocaridina rubra]|uniref:Uncharacterized protein n=1 Tax=Halocaridina rubra TaxID=373956 RepID=A0AAN8WR02_HALRR
MKAVHNLSFMCCLTSVKRERCASSQMIRFNILVLQLLGGDELYHYHSKLMLKDAYVGGRTVWHQDYGLVLLAPEVQ